MEYIHLGRTGLQVSRFCLGTMAFGREADEPTSVRIMDRALELGINFFDTANRYGQTPGVTEEILGRWLAQDKSRRGKIVLASKCFGAMGDGPNDRGLSAYHIRRACDDSLRRLQTDHIDLYQMHHVDRATPWEEIWQAMEQLVREGKVLYVGSSNFAAWQITQAQFTATTRNFLGLASEQSRYSLAIRTIELEVIPACRALGIGILPYGPLRGGILAGGTEQATTGRRSSEGARQLFDKHKTQIDAYETLCHEIGAEPAHVAQAWLLQQSGVTAPILGPRTVEQLEHSVKSAQVKLEDQVLTRLDAIWPGPGEAPEAYGW
ncbi:MAG: oxidoreductase [Chloroflexi bacterium RBG_16_56_8]|nr:MAG: oxidoreductase [Chloroflexi bacterium RBG_16_56_8]